MTLVGRFPITFAEWDQYSLEALRRHSPEDQGWGRGSRPVINVSWNDAKNYIAWLSNVTRKKYRLLSEAEWEYCCRAGTKTRYASGSKIEQQQANLNSVKSVAAKKTLEVGGFPSNDWGIYEMHGNVWEWCEDPWHHNYEGAPPDGSVWGEIWVISRTIRGGSWSEYPDHARSSSRSHTMPDNRNDNVGFRVARDID